MAMEDHLLMEIHSLENHCNKMVDFPLSRLRPEGIFMHSKPEKVVQDMIFLKWLFCFSISFGVCQLDKTTQFTLIRYRDNILVLQFHGVYTTNNMGVS